MNKTEIEQIVKKSLAGVAPEVDVERIDSDKTFRDQFDFDSMDYLTLMTDLNRELGIHIPEIDYPKLSSLASCVDYLDAALRDKAKAS